MEVISLVKQVLKRQGTIPMFALERITEIGIIVQPDDGALCGGHLIAALAKSPVRRRETCYAFYVFSNLLCLCIRVMRYAADYGKLAYLVSGGRVPWWRERESCICRAQEGTDAGGLLYSEMKPGICLPEGSPEREDRRAAWSRQMMMGIRTTRSGSRCLPLFLLLLLGSSCHMLHGQGPVFKRDFTFDTTADYVHNVELLGTEEFIAAGHTGGMEAVLLFRPWRLLCKIGEEVAIDLPCVSVCVYVVVVGFIISTTLYGACTNFKANDGIKQHKVVYGLLKGTADSRMRIDL
ncbi:hypothetical protein EXN66_Car003556 [Channa argus]|uniref:Uncharacterized protein n=1 Tax=Channa argus TaxID=215402 RepID=A0A6G1PCN7_CHAAH|nr:hypothetical protein EXN66_Car003556 [Channa argus]